MKKIGLILMIVLAVVAGCTKDNNAGISHLSIKLIDAPASYDKVNIDIKGLEVIVNDSIIEMDITPGIYNLLELVNGKDTILADQNVPAGRISQIRLILGDNNTLETGSQTFNLTTPSAQQSGLKLNVQNTFVEGVAYEYTIDFDAAMSIVHTGSGKYILKPVLRVSTNAVTGAIKGAYLPLAAKPVIYAISSQKDTISTYPDAETGSYMFPGIPSDTYTLSFVPVDPYKAVTIQNINVLNGSVTTVDTVKFEQ